MVDGAHGVGLAASDEGGIGIGFRASDAPRTGLNPMHLELTSASAQRQQETVDRVLGLGGRHLDVGQLPEEEHVVLADPEGNEFCVIEAGNNFLAGCGFLGALSCDGSQAVGYFWSEALGWPLVWDQDEETAIQSPAGGTKITWGGPPLTIRARPHRVHLDLVVAPGDDPRAEVDRLLALGATRLEPDPLDSALRDGVVRLADPDGNDVCVLPAQRVLPAQP